jgi:hypothetical protein
MYFKVFSEVLHKWQRMHSKANASFSTNASDGKEDNE